jgi:hypothetical protein
MPPTFATWWELSVLHCGRFPQQHVEHITFISVYDQQFVSLFFFYNFSPNWFLIKHSLLILETALVHPESV